MNLTARLLRKLYFKIIRNSTPEFDVSIARNSTDAAFLRLKHLGFQPATILDIGAFNGLWTVSIARIFENVEFHLFEAMPQKRSVIEQNTSHLKVNIHIALLGNKQNVEVPFFAMESGSSIFPEKTEMPRSISTLSMKRLADFPELQNIKGAVLAKLDVQGYELEVLKGAGVLLEKLDAIYLELSTIPYNEGAPSFRDVIDTMDELGYTLFDLGEMHRKGNDHTLLQVDGLFLRKTSPWYLKACNLGGKNFTVYTD